MCWKSIIVKKARCVIPLLVLLLMGFLTSEASALNRILNVRHWVAPDHTRIVIDASEPPDITVEKGNQRILIDFKDTAFPKNLPQKTIFNKPGLAFIFIDRLSENRIRIEISLSDHGDTKVFKLPKFEGKPDRVVVDIELPEVEKKETEEREQVKTARKDRIVVIDPGHGGDDPGAIGWARTQEKDVVLKIARRLRDNLNQREGYRAFLTRNGDYYVPFNKRLKIAREYGADLFLSIHADAARNRHAHGTSVYCLSTGGASTEAARLLARKENLADVMGGSPNGENTDASDPIVLNMYQTNTINTSKTYALSMLKYMEPVIPLKFTTVQGAPFRVLKLPEIPSLLVETAYISNKKEEKLLRSSQHQTKIAAAMASAIVVILPADSGRKAEPAITLTREESKLKDPISGDQKLKIAVQDKGNQGRSAVSTSGKSTVKGKKKPDSDGLQEEPAVYVYRVKVGDTLEKIALKHDTTLGALLKINKMKLKDPLYAGRMVKIKGRPVQKETRAVVKKGVSKQTKKEKFTYYKVKKGETLDIIARRNGITISELRQLNRMKRTDPLWADRKLKLPLPSSL